MTDGARRPRRGAGATIEDVARAAGVSRQTISNALNAPHRVRPTTLAKVAAAIEELGYQPDQSARSLSTGSRRTIGYFAPEDDPVNPNPLMGGFLVALIDAAAEAGHRVLLFRAAPGAADPRPTLDDLIAARQVDGFILSDVVRDDVRISHLAAAGVPFAAFGRTAEGLPPHWVDVDSEQAMVEVAGMLAARGHRRVGYVGSSTDLPWMIARREGFRLGARRHALDVTAALEPATPGDDPAELIESVRGLLRGRDRPTALVAGGDLLALAAYEAIRAEGLAIGRDVAVVGFNDMPLCELLHPRLTSVRLPLQAIARELVRRLLALARGEAAPPAGTLLPAELVLRDSV